MSGGSVRYVAGQAAAHRVMLADAPEAAAAQLAGPGFVEEAVEVRPAGGIAIVRGQMADGTGWRPRSILLHASVQCLAEVDLPWGDAEAGCEGLGAWRAGAP